MIYLCLFAAAVGVFFSQGLTMPAWLWPWLEVATYMSFLGFFLCLAAGNLVRAGLLCLAIFLWAFLFHPALPSSDNTAGTVMTREGSGFGALLVLSVSGKVTRAYGRALAGDSVRILCKPSRSLFEEKFCFAKPIKNSKRAKDGLHDYLISTYGQTISNWLRATLWGHSESLGYVLKEQFKRSGLYHLVVVSGFHVSLIASLVFGVGLSVPWLLNVGRIISPTSFGVAVRLVRLFSICFVWWFAWVAGLGCPAQRAAICYTLLHLGLHDRKVSYGLLIQLILFPCGWFSLSNGLSWCCYLLLATLNESSWPALVVRAIAFSALAWVMLGVFSPMGVLANLLFAPWVAVLILWGAVLLSLPAWDGGIMLYRTAVINTQTLIGDIADWSGYVESDALLFRWVGLSVFCVLVIWKFKPCKTEQKLLS